MSSASKVLVVGGGLSGTSLAIELQRRGMQAEIVEKEEQWGAKGTGITLMAPALRALRHLGLLDQCLPEGYGVYEMKMFTGAGDLIETVLMPGLLGDGEPAIGGMMRPTLHRVLSQTALAEGATVRVGTSVDSLEQDDDHVEVKFTDGTAGIYDLVVGADGIRSDMRRLLLGGDAPAPQELGLDVWRALVPRPAAVTGLFQFYGAEHKTGFTPLTPERMYCFLVQPNADHVRPAPAERPAAMRELLSDFGGLVTEVRDSISQPEQVDVRPLEALLVPPPWYRGRVILIGDAVHASTPQLAMGGAIAIEDAIVLAEVLDSTTDLGSALEGFMKRRYERCRMVVANSVILAEWEKDAAAHGEDSAQLIGESMAALAEAI